LKRPFARPQRRPASRLPFRGQCSRPTSSISIGPSPNPLQPDAPECPACLRSPSGVFMPLRIIAFSRFSLPEAHLRKPPDFLSLPVARRHKMMTTEDQRSRFATSCEVRCFHEPLGPSSKGFTSSTKLATGMHGPSLGNQDSRTTSALLPVCSLPAVTRINAPQPVACSSRSGPIS